MVKDLSKNKSSLSEEKGVEVFDKNSAYTITGECISESQMLSKIKKKSEKTTTIRCSVTTSNRINAIVTSFGMDSVNELLEKLLENYESTLTNDKKRELKTLLEVYNRKNNK